MTKEKKDVKIRHYNYVAFEGEYSIGYKGKYIKKNFNFKLRNYYDDITYLVMILPDGEMVVADKDSYLRNAYLASIKNKKWSIRN